MPRYELGMLKSRIRRRAAQDAGAVNRLAQIEASIMSLKDEDLLDLADIFHEADTPLKDMAARAMVERGISL